MIHRHVTNCDRLTDKLEVISVVTRRLHQLRGLMLRSNPTPSRTGAAHTLSAGISGYIAFAMDA